MEGSGNGSSRTLASLHEEPDFCETTQRIDAIADAEEELSQRHTKSTGKMKAMHVDFRKTLMDID